MKIAASSVDEYLARVPAAHRAALTRVRDVMRKNLPAGYEEGLLYGMPSWYVPPERLAATYNGQPLVIASLASQKSYMALYLLNCYGNPEVESWFSDAFAAAGKKLDMGKSCVRFRRLEDLPLDVIAKVAARTPVDAHVASYLAAQGSRKQKPVVLAGRPAKPATKASMGTPVEKATSAKAGAKPAATKATAAKASATKASKAKPAAMKPSSTKARPAKARAAKPSNAKPSAATASKAKGVTRPSKAKPRSVRAKAGKARR
jgi:Domain of unknown function (DU1801)